MDSVTTGLAVKTDSDHEKLFKNYCSSCHGQTAKVFVDRKWRYGNSKEALRRSITKGIPDAGMPSYEEGLSTEEIAGIADYILSGIEDRNTYTEAERATPSSYRTDYYNLEIDTVVADLEVPWGIKAHQDGTLFFTERKGTFSVMTPDGNITEIQDVPKAKSFGQGGMMDVALHPDYDDNGWIYLSYSKPNGTKVTTAVARGRIDQGRWVDHEEIFEAQPYVSTRYHFGSRIVFDKEGYMYVTVGDRGKRDDHPQFLTNDCGKVHRLHDDGTCPDSNPYNDGDDQNRCSIWSYGHRNQQGMIYDPQSDQIWTHEHGPRGGDELNLIVKGKNYGWPKLSFGINYNGTTFTTETEAEGMPNAKNVWNPSIAPSGMALVSDDYELWSGDILTGSLRFDYVSRIRVENEKVMNEERILEGIGRVRAIEMGADGVLYVGVEDPGRILRVRVVSDNVLEKR